MNTACFDPIRAMSRITKKVLVSYSGGKDSAVVLDLCCRYFDYVEAFFMYIVPDLSFQEEFIRKAELRYGIKVHRIPHFMLSEFYRYGTFRPIDFDVPIVSVREVYNYIREKTGIYWIAGGERITDSTVRRAMIKADGGSINEKRGRFFPIAYWTKQDVIDYVRFRKLFVSRESEILGFSFRSLGGFELAKIREKFPKDFEKIKQHFPYVEASILRDVMVYEQENKI